MNSRLRCSWRLLAGAVLASSLYADTGICAHRPPKRSGRQTTRQVGVEAGQRKQKGDRSRPGRRARDAKSKELFGVSWFSSLESARRAAAEGEPRDAGKPIFCFRVLGDLAGFM